MRKSLLAAAAVLFYLLANVMVQAATLPDFKTIVKENTPAVVKILVEYSDAAASPQNGNPHDNQEIPEYLRRFFEYREGPRDQHEHHRHR